MLNYIHLYYLQANNILYSGSLVSERSMPVNQLLSENCLTEIDSKHTVIAAILDLKRDFGSINRERLSEKLERGRLCLDHN